MSWNDDAKAFFELESEVKNFKLEENKTGFLLRFPNGEAVSVKERPSNKQEWEDRILYFEKAISRYMAKNPVAYCLREVGVENPIHHFSRICIAMHVSAGSPMFKRLVLYHLDNSIIEPKEDFLEDFINSKRFINDADGKPLELDMKLISETLKSYIEKYIEEIRDRVSDDEKKVRLKLIEQLYYPGRRNQPRIFGLPNEALASAFERSEFEQLNKCWEVERLFTLEIVVNLLSIGSISSKIIPFAK